MRPTVTPNIHTRSGSAKHSTASTGTERARQSKRHRCICAPTSGDVLLRPKAWDASVSRAVAIPMQIDTDTTLKKDMATE